VENAGSGDGEAAFLDDCFALLDSSFS
jgi:hypothetical protein